MIEFKVSAQAMSTIQGSEISNDPVKYDGGSQGAMDIFKALKETNPVKFGRGTSYPIVTTVEGALVLANYCQTVGETFAGEAEAETRAEGRVLLTAAQRIHFQIKKQTSGQG